MRRGFGAILISSKGRALRGGGGYPVHIFFERTHWVQAGRLSSHLILRCLAADRVRHKTNTLVGEGARAGSQSTYLQLLQPVLTFGLLVLARFGLSAAEDPEALVEAEGEEEEAGEKREAPDPAL